MLWKGFQKPKRLAADVDTLTEKYGKFQAQPTQQECNPALPQSLEPGGINVGFCDGSVRHVATTVSPRSWWNANLKCSRPGSSPSRPSPRESADICPVCAL